MIRLCFVCCMLTMSSLAQDAPPTGSWLNPRIPIPSTPRLNQQFPVPNRPANVTVTPQEPADTKSSAPCAHMLTFVPPKDTDSSMVFGSGSQSPETRMPVTVPMPVCPEDVRQSPETKKK